MTELQIRPSPPAAPAVDLRDTTLYINRELSWLEFNRRVLHEATDIRTPLLERVKFLAIYSSNSDEFFMKRVGLLRRKIAQKSAERSHDGLTAEQHYQVVRERLQTLTRDVVDLWTQVLRPELEKE